MARFETDQNYRGETVAMIQRMIRAAQLKAEVYEEVEADKSATVQAMTVVVLAALATGIAFLGVGVAANAIDVALTVVFALLGWALLAWITYLVGTRLFPTPETSADWGELARTLGFAQSPGVLRIFLIVPGIGPLIFLIASIWTLVATVIAIRQALDYTSTWRAVGVAIASYIPQSLLLGIAASLFV